MYNPFMSERRAERSICYALGSIPLAVLLACTNPQPANETDQIPSKTTSACVVISKLTEGTKPSHELAIVLEEGGNRFLYTRGTRALESVERFYKQDRLRVAARAIARSAGIQLSSLRRAFVGFWEAHAWLEGEEGNFLVDGGVVVGKAIVSLDVTERLSPSCANATLHKTPQKRS